MKIRVLLFAALLTVLHASVYGQSEVKPVADSRKENGTGNQETTLPVYSLDKYEKALQAGISKTTLDKREDSLKKYPILAEYLTAMVPEESVLLDMLKKQKAPDTVMSFAKLHPKEALLLAKGGMAGNMKPFYDKWPDAFEGEKLLVVAKYIRKGTTELYHIKPWWQETESDREMSKRVENMIITEQPAYMYYTDVVKKLLGKMLLEYMNDMADNAQ